MQLEFSLFVCRAVVSQVITGYLPSLILQLFLSFVPPIMIMLSSLQGYISWSEIQKSACTKVLWFTIWNIFFANVLSGSALYRVNVFLEPKKIPEILAEAVPAQVRIFSSFCLCKIVVWIFTKCSYVYKGKSSSRWFFMYLNIIFIIPLYIQMVKKFYLKMRFLLIFPYIVSLLKVKQLNLL